MFKHFHRQRVSVWWKDLVLRFSVRWYLSILSCLEHSVAMWPQHTIRKRTYIFICLLNYLLTAWSRTLLEKLTCTQIVRKCSSFYETEGSLPHSQVPAACPYPEPHRSRPCPLIPVPEDPSELYPPIYVCVFQVVTFPSSFPPYPFIQLFSPPACYMSLCRKTSCSVLITKSESTFSHTEEPKIWDWLLNPNNIFTQYLSHLSSN